MRIVSLLPACTEWVAAFGAEGDLVGRSHACDFPSSVRGLPALIKTFVPAGASKEIDAYVRSGAGETKVLYELDADRLVRLKPDVILTQSQCSVCSIALADVEEVVGTTEGNPPEVFAMGPNTFKDVLDAALRLAKTIGRAQEAMAFIAAKERRLRELQLAVGRDLRAEDRPSIVCIEWLDPLMTAGHWTPGLIDLAGGRALLASAGEPSACVDWSAILESDPDVVAIMPCGRTIDETRSELKSLTQRSGWAKMKAVREGRVFVFDGNAYFSRPGPRLYRAIELLALILHPRKVSGTVGEWEMEPVRIG